MSNLDIRLSNLDIRMSSLDIRMSKLILEFEKIKTAKNSRLNVAFRMYLNAAFRMIFGIFRNPMVKKLEMVRSKSIIRLDIHVSRLDIRMSNLKLGVGHTYVQAIMKPIRLDI